MLTNTARLHLDILGVWVGLASAVIYRSGLRPSFSARYFDIAQSFYLGSPSIMPKVYNEY